MYHDNISHSYNISAGQFQITNWHCNNLALHLCTTWGTLASDSNKFCSALQLDSTVNYVTHKYFINFTMDQHTATASPKRLYLEFSSGYTVDIEIKEIYHRRIPSRDL